VFYFIGWGHPAHTPETETWRKFLGAQVGIDLDDKYRPLRNRDNNFWQDRKAMKAGNFTGITGFPNQDIAMWVTMGPIADRTFDRLGASDLAIVEFRRQMLDAVREFEHGKPAIGTGSARIPRDVCSYQAIVPKTTDWRSFDVQYVWDAA
jgi:phthalate 4,5-dioxygenase oxygenase subunit